MAGSRTRIYCLEGNNANRYTTNAELFKPCRTSVASVNLLSALNIVTGESNSDTHRASAFPVQLSVGGVTVSIVAFQAVDPGSTPGQRIFFAF